MGFIEVNAGGKIHATTTETLQKVKDSYLDKLTQSADAPRDTYGRLFIDCDGKRFGMVLDHLRGLPLPPLKPAKAIQLSCDAERFMLPTLTHALAHELQGARHTLADDTCFGAILRGAALLRVGDDGEAAYRSLLLGILMADANGSKLQSFWKERESDWSVVFAHAFLLLNKHPSRAIGMLRAAATMQPEAACIPIALSQALMARKRWAEATDVAREAIVKHPTRWELHFTLALNLGRQARSTESMASAAEAMEKAAEFAVNRPEAVIIFMCAMEMWSQARRKSDALRVCDAFVADLRRSGAASGQASMAEMRESLEADDDGGPDAGEYWRSEVEESPALMWRAAYHQAKKELANDYASDSEAETEASVSDADDDIFQEPDED